MADKIRMTQSELMICKALAANDIARAQAEAQEKGEPFDYEAVKAQREQEMILAYARELRRMNEWDKRKDKAFHSLIGEFCRSTKLYNYICNHVPDMATLRKMDPEEVRKTASYGQKTVDEIKKLQGDIERHRSILTAFNKALADEHRTGKFLEAYGDIIREYNALKRRGKNTRLQLEHVWRRYNGKA